MLADRNMKNQIRLP